MIEKRVYHYLILLLTVATHVASAAPILGTTWVNFGGQAVAHYPDPNNAGTPPTTFNAMSVNGLFGGGFTDAANLAGIQTGTVNLLNADYTGFGMTFTTVQPMAGNFNTLVIGNPNGGDGTNLYGQTDNIDFRNKIQNNTVGVSVTAHSNHAAPGGGWTAAVVSQVIANTASHELGHALGLVHSDVVSTFADTAGNAAAKNAAVQANEQMTKTPNNVNFFADLAFGRYSQTKLDIGGTGINVGVENGNVSFISPAALDPLRAGDAGAAIGTGTALIFDSKNRVTELGSFGAADTDVFTFSALAGQKLIAEFFSITIAHRLADTVDGALLEVLDALGNVLMTLGAGMSNLGNDFDGLNGSDVESRTLLFEYLLPGMGANTYGLRLSGQGADPTGQYELLVMVAPEPSGMALIAIGMLALTVCGRRRKALGATIRLSACESPSPRSRR